MAGYTIYGNWANRCTVTLATVMVAKKLDVEVVEETASLAFALATRSGDETGPYLRTPEGFVLSDLHTMLDWVERLYPEPRLLPTTPIRGTCARLIEDWIELWLPLWPRRSWSTIERLGAHLESAGFLLGPTPCRPDWILAAWLETEVLVHEHARVHLAKTAPRLVSLGAELLEWTRLNSQSTSSGGDGSEARRRVDSRDAEDVIPISLLDVLEEIGNDYHAYLVENYRACKDGADHVLLDLGLGRRAMPVRGSCEERRAEIGRGLRALSRSERHAIRQVLEPVGAWHVTTLPPVLGEVDPADPRSL